MVICEDRGFEDFVLSGQSCYAVPVEVYIPADGSEPVITSYSGCMETAQRIDRILGKEVKYADVKNDILKGLSAFAESIGYRYFHSENETMREYSLKSISQLNNTVQNYFCRKITSESELSELCENSGCDIELSGDDDVIFAVIKDGKIEAYAGVNDTENANIAPEISVETAPSLRRKGYGSACVTRLAAHLLKKCRCVLYKCAADNTASSSLAEKCGFVLDGTRFSFVCEKI